MKTSTSPFFYYKKVEMNGNSIEEKSIALMILLGGAAFSFYYHSYSQDESLMKAARDYPSVKESLITDFSAVLKQKDVIEKSIACYICPANGKTRLCYLYCGSLGA